MNRRGFFFAAAAMACLLGSPAYAQQWPTRAVKFIVPLGPGSGVDITARLIGDRLSKKWNQAIVVENRPGGGAQFTVRIPAPEVRPFPTEVPA